MTLRAFGKLLYLEVWDMATLWQPSRWDYGSQMLDGRFGGREFWFGPLHLICENLTASHQQPS